MIANIGFHKQDLLYSLGTDSDDLVFEDHVSAFQWLQEMMSKNGQDRFSESFDKIELVWVPDTEIEKNLLDKKLVRKIPKVKSYNCVTAIAGKPGVYIKDCSCNCEKCKAGDVLNCTETSSTGAYKQQTITRATRAQKHVIDSDTHEESEPEIEFVCDDTSSEEDTDIEESDDFTDFVNDDFDYVATPLNPGLYLLYEYTNSKYFVGCITATLPDKRQVRFMRKSIVSSSHVTFSWPDELDEPILDVEKLTKSSKPLPDPISLRRGGIQYPCYVFNGINLGSLY